MANQKRSWAAVLLVSVALVALVIVGVASINGEVKPNPVTATDPYDAPMVITSTKRFDPEYIDVEDFVITTTVYYSDSLHYAVIKPGESQWRSEEATLREVNDDTVDYYWEEFARPRYLVDHNEAPPVDNICWMSSDTDWYVDLDTIASLQSANQISVTTGSDLFGRDAAIADKVNGIHGNPLVAYSRCRVTYDSETGFRFKIETFGGRTIWSEYSVDDLVFDWSVDGDLLKAPLTRDVRTSYGTRAFDPDSDYEYETGASEVVSPTESSFSNGFEAGPLAYLQDDYHLSTGTTSWAVAQQLLGPDWKEIVVVQSTDSNVTDTFLSAFWPDDGWINGAPPDNLGSVSTLLESGPSVEVYELDTNEWRAHYLVTWMHTSALRILFVGNENVTSEELVTAINEYLAEPR
jgi:hypothetical protein